MHARPSSTSASAVTPASAVVLGRRTPPGSARRRWGCVRTAWRSGPSRRGFRRRVPPPCRARGRRGHPGRPCLPRIAASSSRRAWSNSTTGREGLPGDPDVDTVVLAALAGRLLDAPTTLSRVDWSAARESSQPRTREGMALTPFGSTATLPKVATAPASSGLPAGGQHRLGVGQHRVAAVGQPGGARVVGLAVEVEPPAAVRPDRGRRRRPGRR